MRIISGKFRAKNLFAPEGKTTRPTSDRAREAIFNVLESRRIGKNVSWADITVADAFAGTGALGLEAMSRGASSLTAFEKDAAAKRCFYKNAQAFIDAGASVRLFDDALTPPATQKAVRLLFMDPPYAKGFVAPALQALKKQGWIDGETLCVIETEKSEKDVLPDGFEAQDRRFYGKAAVLFVKAK